MHSNRSNPSQFRVSHLSRQSTVRLYCMAAVWYRYCNVWLLYGTNYCMAGTVWLQLYGCTAVLYGTCTRMARILLDLSIVLYGGTGTTVRLYGTVWLYSCMVLTVWAILVGSYYLLRLESLDHSKNVTDDRNVGVVTSSIRLDNGSMRMYRHL